MTSWEDVVSKARSVARTAGEKTGELVEQTKLKVQIADLRREAAKVYEGLGRLVYDGRKAEEPVDDMIEACIEQLDDLQQQIDELENRLLNARDAVRCEGCGNYNPVSAAFCNQCGAKLDK